MKIVITGSSGAGKTTLINKLKELGYQTITETPAEVISEGYNDLKERQKECIKRQLIKELDIKGLVFFDRGLGDILGFCEYFNVCFKRIKFNYDKVFYLPRSRTKDFSCRVENSTLEADKIFYKYILPKYKKAIKLPEKNELDFILKFIKTHKHLTKNNS